MLGNTKPPRLPDPGAVFDPRQEAYVASLLRTLRQFFDGITAEQPVTVTRLNINIDRLPTQADLADLRAGDVYRDTSAANVLKIKT
jgi:hypothetical protein